MKLNEFMKIAGHLPDDTEVDIVSVGTGGRPISVAHWKVWGGWAGNHDQRIEDAECSCCGYEHPTVYGSLDKLAGYCPKCGSKMEKL